MIFTSNTVQKNSFCLFSIILLCSPALHAGEYDEDIIRANEPAMRNIVEPQTLNDIRDIMIRESIEKHGFCACPYSTDALGGQCGTLSAYYLPWNKIVCYRRDITGEMVYFYRLQNALNVYQLQLDEEQAKQAAEEAKANAAQAAENRRIEADVRRQITSDYFKNTGRPDRSRSTFDTINNVLNNDGEFKQVVPVKPASNMTDLIAPSVSAP